MQGKEELAVMNSGLTDRLPLFSFISHTKSNEERRYLHLWGEGAATRRTGHHSEPSPNSFVELHSLQKFV